jgi:hypothetical protein
MNSKHPFLIALAWLGLVPLAWTGSNYANFKVAVYIPVNVVQGFAQRGQLEGDWLTISRQLKVDKVYLEVQRDGRLASDEVLESAKAFFLQRHVEVAGGMALSDGSSGGQFKSFCYTDPTDRAFIRKAAELAARHFDEVIQDDFFFVSTKTESDIAAKGGRSWTQFRLALMDDAAENLLVKPAKAVNPKVKMIVKFPNWYEHFQGSGYDLDREPRIFDSIYTGTETRDPVITDQHLQPYESYEIIRYFENIAPGRNGGGWVDTYNLRYLDRYAEQLWDTMFAKAPQMTLFEWSALCHPIDPGERPWKNQPTSFNYLEMLQTRTNLTAAGVAAYSLEQVDKIIGRLGHPIGLAAYKPYQSSGEDYLHNYLGMIGIPIDLHPDFPTNSALILLTESAKADPDLVTKIKDHLRAGGSIIVTSGLLRALQDRGLQDIAEVRCTERRFHAHQYASGFGAGNFSAFDDATNADVLFPEIDFLTNDSWALVRAEANANGFPLLLMNRYGRGILYVWTVPDNFTDLYALPTEVTSAMKNFFLRGFPVRLDGPAQIALFAYDNQTFIIESFLPMETDATIGVLGSSTRIENLVTGEMVDGRPPHHNQWEQRNALAEDRVTFKIHLFPHSYTAFAIEPAGQADSP